MISTIHVRFAEPGWHHWPGASPRRNYLAASHRHLFHVEIGMGVNHDDREVEFHDLRDEGVALLKGLADDKGDFGAKSCEAIAREMAQVLAERYQRQVSVSVWEDKEFGATVTAAPL